MTMSAFQKRCEHEAYTKYIYVNKMNWINWIGKILTMTKVQLKATQTKQTQNQAFVLYQFGELIKKIRHHIIL